MQVWTLGRWIAKAGHEELFIEAWEAFARSTQEDFPGANAILLRDPQTPNVFFSVGPWESLEQIATWRTSATFVEGVEAIRSHLESFEPHTLDPVVRID